MSYREKRYKGFTLIEILVVIVVMAILFGVGAKIVSTTMHSWCMITLRKEMLFSSRVGMNRMVRDIRLANTAQITTFNPADFQFTNIRGEAIRFWLDGTTLKRNNDLLVDNLQSGSGLQLTYFDPNGNPPAAASQIRRVAIRLNLQEGDQTFAYRSEARIRN